MQVKTNVRPPSNNAKPSDRERMRRLSREAEQWVHFVQRHSPLGEEYLIRKAAQSVRYCLAKNTRTTNFSICTKLVGTGKRQEALETLRGFRLMRGHRLETNLIGDRIHVSFAGMTIGQMDPCHTPWLRPLLEAGARVNFLYVTGWDASYKSYGCNVLIAGITPAIRSIMQPSGDGQASAPPAIDENVRLWREAGGRPCCNIAHFRRHSDILEWTDGSFGAADLARSILIRFVGLRAAETLYERFQRDIITQVPPEGGLIEAALIRSWLARQSV